ncbi:MAG: HAD hydrolase-like protein, partial [Bacteroidetes bacterium]|nr:HAD hydrolase-like protein [Bacteroidota bacterium]
LATHCDLVCPTSEGLVPDIGSMLALIEATTKKKPVKVFGKPNPEMVEHILIERGVNLAEIAVIGDRLYTDMALARELGCDFVCVLSGETKREDIENLDDLPDLIVNSVAEI